MKNVRGGLTEARDVKKIEREEGRGIEIVIEGANLDLMLIDQEVARFNQDQISVVIHLLMKKIAMIKLRIKDCLL